MKLLASLAVAFTLTLGAMASAQECATPKADAAEILKDHGAPVAFFLEGEKAKDFARKTNAPDQLVATLTHIQLWLLPGGMQYMVAFYIDGCRGGAFAMPVGAAPVAFRVRGA